MWGRVFPVRSPVCLHSSMQSDWEDPAQLPVYNGWGIIHSPKHGKQERATRAIGRPRRERAPAIRRVRHRIDFEAGMESYGVWNRVRCKKHAPDYGRYEGRGRVAEDLPCCSISGLLEPIFQCHLQCLTICCWQGLFSARQFSQRAVWAYILWLWSP